MRFPSPIRTQLQATSLIGVVLALITLAGAPAPAMAQYDYPEAPPVDDTAATPSDSDSATPVASDCDPEAAAEAAPEVYAIDGAASTAKYVAQQEVVTFGAQEVVGSTNAIIGSILFDDERHPLECSSFAVDMRTLVTDEPMRDNYLRGNTLESDTFPFATFVVASVAGLDGGLTDGETTSIQLVGDLTLHGVTRPATWDAEVALDGNTLTGTASTTFAIADYEMEKPIVGPVLSIEDEIELDVEITATSEA